TGPLRRSCRSATGHKPTTGCRQSPERAQASGRPVAPRAADNRATRSPGRKGQSPGTLTTSAIAGACAAAQSSPARIPASGPAKPATLSGTTGRPVSAKRAGSPLALRMIAAHCGLRHASTRSSMVWPAMRMRALSPPPMRRANPPASTRPSGAGAEVVILISCAGRPVPQRRIQPRRAREASIIVHRGFAPVLGALLLDQFEVLIEHDALLARARDETLAARATDQRKIRLARKLDAPGGEAGARDQDRDAHAHGLDHHL